MKARRLQFLTLNKQPSLCTAHIVKELPYINSSYKLMHYDVICWQTGEKEKEEKNNKAQILKLIHTHSAMQVEIETHSDILCVCVDVFTCSHENLSP